MIHWLATDNNWLTGNVDEFDANAFSSITDHLLDKGLGGQAVFRVVWCLIQRRPWLAGLNEHLPELEATNKSGAGWRTQRTSRGVSLAYPNDLGQARKTFHSLQSWRHRPGITGFRYHLGKLCSHVVFERSESILLLSVRRGTNSS